MHSESYSYTFNYSLYDIRIVENSVMALRVVEALNICKCLNCSKFFNYFYDYFSREINYLVHSNSNYHKIFVWPGFCYIYNIRYTYTVI